MFSDIVAILAVAGPYILQAEANVGDGNGAAKKAQVTSALKTEIDKPGGIDFPGWLPNAAKEPLLGAIIEFGHFLFERFGGAGLVKKLSFGSSGSVSSGSPTAPPSSGGKS